MQSFQLTYSNRLELESLCSKATYKTKREWANILDRLLLNIVNAVDAKQQQDAVNKAKAESSEKGISEDLIDKAVAVLTRATTDEGPPHVRIDCAAEMAVCRRFARRD